MLAGVWGILISSCSGFLDTAPNDALDPSNTWKTEQDAEKFLVGCYDDWIDEKGIYYWDCASDFGYSNFLWDHYQSIGNGSMAAGLKDTVVLAISKDLPFAHGRFCTTEGIENVIPLSDFRFSDFDESYGVRMADGPLAGLLARAVVVIGKDGKIAYTELVPEITQEPDYDKALAAVK